jgi:hypothetical protein
MVIDVDEIAQSYQCLLFPLSGFFICFPLSSAYVARSDSPSSVPDPSLSPPPSTDEARSVDGSSPSDTQSSSVPVRDNRNLFDTSTAQRLTQDDIERMKKDGAHATEIVGALITQSSTFQGKTEFSKEKYIKKKLNKYHSSHSLPMSRFHLRIPGTCDS